MIMTNPRSASTEVSLVWGTVKIMKIAISPPIVCNLNAIGTADRPRYRALMDRLRDAIQDRSELADGYVFKLDGTAVSLPEVTEWMSLESLCCPFFSFQVSAYGERDEWSLELTGPEGVKPLIEGAFRPS